ncbi:MAG TPA: SMC family ATPase, partial [Gemmataceae bacterium]|nr:SMC family ATPase [Gemmataceae bacterium]
ARGGVKGTQNVFRKDDATGKWVAVADTNLSDGFKAWVRDKIGLNYDTFTSSVLLLQGRAEKLLDSKPSGRAEVLAGIVDLERYQKLHEKADARRKELKAKLEAVQGQATGIPEVSDIELIAAENRVDEAEQARTDAGKEVDRLQQVEYRARRWADLRARLDGLHGRLGKAQALIAESDAIEKAYRRFRDLRDVIPHVLVIQEKQRAVAESDARTKQLDALREHALEQRATADDALETARKKRTSHQKTLMQDEQKLQDVGVRLRDLSAHLGTLRTYEEQTTRVDQFARELSRLPKDIDALVQQAQEEFDRRAALGATVPKLEQFAIARDQLRAATVRVAELHKAETETKEKGEKARDAHGKFKEGLTAATAAREQADEAATEARTLYQQAKGAADEFGKLEGAKVCRACGQPLTPAHWEVEKGKRDKELKQTAANQKKTTEARTAAAAVEATARERFEAADRNLLSLREVYRDTVKERELAGKDVERLVNECRQAYLKLAEEDRPRVAATPPADWLTTAWPSAAELAALHKEAGDLDAARADLREAQAKKAKADKLHAEHAAAVKTLEQVKSSLPPGDPRKLRDKEAEYRGQEESLKLQVRAHKQQIIEADQEADRLNKALGTIHQQLSTIDAQTSAEEASRREFRDAIDRAGRMLPEAWRQTAVTAGLAEQNKWKAELEDLTRKGTEAKYHELGQTRASIEAVRQDIALATEEEKGFTPEERQPADEIRARIAAARELATQRNEDVQKAREEKAVLGRHRAERARLAAQTLELEKDLNFATILAQLLGRDRLQRHLVRTAERQIVDYANGILDRLSGGQLFLRLCGGEDGGTDRALDLEASNRNTTGGAINVAFLSGSQRFRVAVSLALGMGQYASRQHRPIESVIIDEGFGCLDRNNRQVMIQELQNLRSHLQCILLVSHQEEFAEAFPDGYRFELTDGATKVTRIQR